MRFTEKHNLLNFIIPNAATIKSWKRLTNLDLLPTSIAQFWRRLWEVTGSAVRNYRIGAERTQLKVKCLLRTLKWFILVFDCLSIVHVTITLQYLGILCSFDPLLNGNGLATLHAPGYASPDGTVTFVVKLAPAKEIQTRHGQDFQSNWEKQLQRMVNRSVEQCCAKFHLQKELF